MVLFNHPLKFEFTSKNFCSNDFNVFFSELTDSELALDPEMGKSLLW